MSVEKRDIWALVSPRYLCMLGASATTKRELMCKVDGFLKQRHRRGHIKHSVSVKKNKCTQLSPSPHRWQSVHTTDTEAK